MFGLCGSSRMRSLAAGLALANTWGVVSLFEPEHCHREPAPSEVLRETRRYRQHDPGRRRATCGATGPEPATGDPRGRVAATAVDPHQARRHADRGGQGVVWACANHFAPV